MERYKVLQSLRHILADSSVVLAARAYGSWFHNETAVDLDVAVIVPGDHGLVAPSVYQALYFLRRELSDAVGCDVDLVPHTSDEIAHPTSPIWYPRYNPSLVFGQILKGEFEVSSVSLETAQFGFRELTAYVLHDNRTICRRQLVRTLDGEAGRIYVSKLLHGPGNALTYYVCEHQLPYMCSPSNLMECFRLFDAVFHVDSSPAEHFFRRCKSGIDLSRARQLMGWYERLVALVLYGSQFTSSYQEWCRSLGHNGLACQQSE